MTEVEWQTVLAICEEAAASDRPILEVRIRRLASLYGRADRRALSLARLLASARRRREVQRRALAKWKVQEATRGPGAVA